MLCSEKGGGGGLGPASLAPPDTPPTAPHRANTALNGGGGSTQNFLKNVQPNNQASAARVHAPEAGESATRPQRTHRRGGAHPPPPTRNARTGAPRRNPRPDRPILQYILVSTHLTEPTAACNGRRNHLVAPQNSASRRGRGPTPTAPKSHAAAEIAQARPTPPRAALRAPPALQPWLTQAGTTSAVRQGGAAAEGSANPARGARGATATKTPATRRRRTRNVESAPPTPHGPTSATHSPC